MIKHPYHNEVDDADDGPEEQEDLVSLASIPPLSREEFYEKLADLKELEAANEGLDPDDPECELLVTILHLDKKYGEAMRKIEVLLQENAVLKKGGRYESGSTVPVL